MGVFSSPEVHQPLASSDRELSSHLQLDKTQYLDKEEQQRAGQINPSPAVAQALEQEMGVLELHDTGLDGYKAHFQGRKALVQGWRSRGTAVRRVGRDSSHPGPSSSWHRAHPKAKSSGALCNLVRRQFLLVCCVIKLAGSPSRSSTRVLGAV